MKSKKSELSEENPDDFFYEHMDLVLKYFKREDRDSFITHAQIMRSIQERESIKPLDPRRSGMLLRELFGDPIRVKINGKITSVYYVSLNH